MRKKNYWRYIMASNQYYQEVSPAPGVMEWLPMKYFVICLLVGCAFLAYTVLQGRQLLDVFSGFRINMERNATLNWNLTRIKQFLVSQKDVKFRPPPIKNVAGVNYTVKGKSNQFATTYQSDVRQTYSSLESISPSSISTKGVNHTGITPSSTSTLGVNYRGTNKQPRTTSNRQTLPISSIGNKQTFPIYKSTSRNKQTLPVSTTQLIVESSKHDFQQTQCKYIYFDLGTNIGVQIRKFFEPTKYPQAKILDFFDENIGLVDDRRLYGCVFGFEANPKHLNHLHALEKAYRALGWKVRIQNRVVYNDSSEIIPIYTDKENRNEDWGAGIQQNKKHTGCVTREKVPNGLSRFNTKKRIGTCDRAHLSFGMTPTF